MVDERLGGLATAVDRLSSQMENDRSSANALDRIADAQSRLADGQEKMVAGQERMAQGQDRIVNALAEEVEREVAELESAGGFDGESRMRLRSIDTQLLRILEEMAVGRQESLADLRADLSQLTRSVRQLGTEISDGGRRRE
jgi:hypothetical protein